MQNTTKIMLTFFMLALMTVSYASASSNYSTHQHGHKYPTFEAITDYDFSNNYFLTEVKAMQQEVKINHFWNVLVISDSANFENSNECLCYHIIDDGTGRVYIYDETGAVSISSFKELSKYECHFFEDDYPVVITQDGSMSSNLKDVMEEWL